MRLIDADTLRDILVRMSRTADFADPPVRRGIDGSVKFVDAAPTVCCEECALSWDSKFDKRYVHCKVHSRTRPKDWFCGDFERRQP